MMSNELAHRIYENRHDYKKLRNIMQESSVFMFIRLINTYSFSDEVILDVLKNIPDISGQHLGILINQSCHANLFKCFDYLINNYLLEDEMIKSLVKLIISRDRHTMLKECLTTHRQVIGHRIIECIRSNLAFSDEIVNHLSYKCYEVLLDNDVPIYFLDPQNAKLFLDLINDSPSEQSIQMVRKQLSHSGSKIKILPSKFIDHLINNETTRSTGLYLASNCGYWDKILSSQMSDNEFRTLIYKIDHCDIAIELFNKHKPVIDYEIIDILLFKPSFSKLLDHIIINHEDKEMLLLTINDKYDEYCSDRNYNQIYHHVPVLVKH